MIEELEKHLGQDCFYPILVILVAQPRREEHFTDALDADLSKDAITDIKVLIGEDVEELRQSVVFDSMDD